MKLRSVLVLAPGHDESDRRVNRSIDVFSQLFKKTIVFYESRFSLVQDPSLIRAQQKDKISVSLDLTTSRGVEIHYIEGTKPRGFIIPTKKYIEPLSMYLKESDCVYIHASGILGVLLAVNVKRYWPTARVVLDYHDWIPWEIYYQISKIITNEKAVKAICSMTLPILRSYIRWKLKLDAIVGISEGQITAFKKFMGGSLSNTLSLVIPNTRPFLNEPFVCSERDGIALLWIGNIMGGKDLLLLMAFLSRFREDVPGIDLKLQLCGNIMDKEIFSRLCSNEYVTYLGSYKTDEGIKNLLLNERCIGVFLGLDDKIDTGVNAIVSSNKIYSYVNLGIPIIYHDSLRNIVEIMGKESGIPISSYEAFKEAVIRINDEYELFQANACELKTRVIWDGTASELLTHFMRKLLAA